MSASKEAVRCYLAHCDKEGLRVNQQVKTTLGSTDSENALDLSTSYLGPRQSKAIVLAVLPALTDLQCLNLMGVGLNDDIVEVLVRTCSGHSLLHTLNISENPMLTDRSVSRMLQMAKDCPALEQIHFFRKPEEHIGATALLSSVAERPVGQSGHGLTEFALHKLEVQLDCNRLANRRNRQKAAAYITPTVSQRYLDLCGNTNGSAPPLIRQREATEVAPVEEPQETVPLHLLRQPLTLPTATLDKGQSGLASPPLKSDRGGTPSPLKKSGNQVAVVPVPPQSKSNAHRAVVAALEDSTRVETNLNLNDIQKRLEASATTITAGVDVLFPEDWECNTNADDEELMALRAEVPENAIHDEELLAIGDEESIYVPPPEPLGAVNPSGCAVHSLPSAVVPAEKESKAHVPTAVKLAQQSQHRATTGAMVLHEQGHVGVIQTSNKRPSGLALSALRTETSASAAKAVGVGDKGEDYRPRRRPTKELKGSIDVLPDFVPLDETLANLLQKGRGLRLSGQAKIGGSVKAEDIRGEGQTAVLLHTDPEFPPQPQTICSRSSFASAAHQCRHVVWRRLSSLFSAKDPSTLEWFCSPRSLYVSSGLHEEYFLRQAKERLPHRQASSEAESEDEARKGKGKGEAELAEWMSGFPVLANQWFVNALNIIRQSPGMVRALLVRSHPELGLFTVRFFKNGTPIEVTVDDYIPCYNSPEAQALLPLYGSTFRRTVLPGATHRGECVTSNDTVEPFDLWASVVEKAYAKLHGGYDRLRGGSVSQALQDLTDGYCHKWTWSLATVQNLIRTTRRAKQREAATSKKLLSLKDSGTKESNASEEESTKTAATLTLETITQWLEDKTKGSDLLLAEPRATGFLEKAALYGCGLLPNQVYIIRRLESIPVPKDATDGGPEDENFILLRLSSPHEGVLWQRQFAPSTGSRPEEGEGRSLVHRMFLDRSEEVAVCEGEFVVSLEDFLIFFNSIVRVNYPSTVPRLLCSYCKSSVGYWIEESAGGLLDCAFWTENPAFYLRAARKYSTVIVELSQRDERLNQKNETAELFYSTIQLLGFRIQEDDISVENRRRRDLPLSRMVVAVSCCSRSIAVEVQVHPERPVYLVLANDENQAPIAPGDQHSTPAVPSRGNFRFKVRCISSDPVTLEEARREQPVRQFMTGSWTGESAAGRLGGIDAGLEDKFVQSDPKAETNEDGDSVPEDQQAKRPVRNKTSVLTLLNRLSAIELNKVESGCGNPQFRLTTATAQRVTIVLTQEMRSDDLSGMKRRPGLYAIALHALYNQELPVKLCTYVDKRTEFERRRSVTLDIDTGDLWRKAEEEEQETREPLSRSPGSKSLAPQERSFLVIPTTWAIGERATFQLTVFSEFPVRVIPIS